MEYEELTHKIIGCAYKVFNQLGLSASPAWLEGGPERVLE
jgi:hypothetical protein